MPAFYELPRVSQMTLIKHFTSYPTWYEVNDRYVVKPRLSYSRKDPKRTLTDIQVSPYLFPNEHLETLHDSRVKNSVIKLITMEPLTTDLQLYDMWGFVLEDNGHPIVICQNLQPVHHQRIAVIRMDRLWGNFNEPKKETHPRVRMLWGAGLFALLAAASHLLKN